jgi:hypothetical protein
MGSARSPSPRPGSSSYRRRNSLRPRCRAGAASRHRDAGFLGLPTNRLPELQRVRVYLRDGRCRQNDADCCPWLPADRFHHVASHGCLAASQPPCAQTGLPVISLAVQMPICRPVGVTDCIFLDAARSSQHLFVRLSRAREARPEGGLLRTCFQARVPRHGEAARSSRFEKHESRRQVGSGGQGVRVLGVGLHG